MQEVPEALTALKYFNEDAPQYQIVCAGSLLGIALHQGTSFPVGKVEFLDLYPMSFLEFMLAIGKKQYVELLQKHAPNETVPRIRMLWNSIPAQLAKENKKFIYGLIKEGSRAKEYELAMLWLTDCGLIHKVHRVTTSSLPLRAYEDQRAFKLFLVDIGLLACMAGLRQDVLLDGNELFKEFKGALTEQYVLQQLKTLKGVRTYYWTAERATAEVDFLIDNGIDVIPIEVKAETNLQAKSLKVYYEKFKPRLSIRTSMADYKKEDWLLNLPLWAVGIAFVK